MREGWNHLECVDCETQWDVDPADIPIPGTRYACDHCDSERPVVEFVKTWRGLDILKEFHTPA